MEKHSLWTGPEAKVGVTRGMRRAYFGDLIIRLSPALFLSKLKKVQEKKEKESNQRKWKDED